MSRSVVSVTSLQSAIMVTRNGKMGMSAGRESVGGSAVQSHIMAQLTNKYCTGLNTTVMVVRRNFDCGVN